MAISLSLKSHLDGCPLPRWLSEDPLALEQGLELCFIWCPRSLTSILGNSEFPVPFVGRPGKKRNEGNKKQTLPSRSSRPKRPCVVELSAAMEMLRVCAGCVGTPATRGQ